MKTKVFEMKDTIHLVCINDRTGKYAAYRLYLLYPGKDKYGYCTEHRKQLANYGDMHSVICHVSDLYKAGMQHKPYDIVLAWNKQYYRPV